MILLYFSLLLNIFFLFCSRDSVLAASGTRFPLFFPFEGEPFFPLSATKAPSCERPQQVARAQAGGPAVAVR
jgi:hypothetical protein